MAQKELTFFNDVPAFASFPFLFEPRTTDIDGKPMLNKDGTPKEIFEVTSCFDPNHPMFIKRIEEMKAVALRVLREKFGQKAEFGKFYRSPFRDGADFDLDRYPNYEGKVIVGMKSTNRRVDLKDVQMNNLTDKRDIYPGCVIVPSFGFYAYDNVSKGVSGALRGVVKLANSTPWVVIASAERDFAGIDFSQYAETANEMYEPAGLSDL